MPERKWNDTHKLHTGRVVEYTPTAWADRGCALIEVDGEWTYQQIARGAGEFEGCLWAYGTCGEVIWFVSKQAEDDEAFSRTAPLLPPAATYTLAERWELLCCVTVPDGDDGIAPGLRHVVIGPLCSVMVHRWRDGGSIECSYLLEGTDPALPERAANVARVLQAWLATPLPEAATDG